MPPMWVDNSGLTSLSWFNGLVDLIKGVAKKIFFLNKIFAKSFKLSSCGHPDIIPLHLPAQYFPPTNQTASANALHSVREMLVDILRISFSLRTSWPEQGYDNNSNESPSLSLPRSPSVLHVIVCLQQSTYSALAPRLTLPASLSLLSVVVNCPLLKSCKFALWNRLVGRTATAWASKPGTRDYYDDDTTQSLSWGTFYSW